MSVILLLISFTQPAFYIDSPENPSGWSDSKFLFFLGWMSFLGGYILGTIIWLSNPIYLFSMFLIMNKKDGFYWSLLSTILALIFSQLNSIMTSESGTYTKISSLETGYKFWLASFVVLTIGTGINHYLLNKKLK